MPTAPTRPRRCTRSPPRTRSTSRGRSRTVTRTPTCRCSRRGLPVAVNPDRVLHKLARERAGGPPVRAPGELERQLRDRVHVSTPRPAVAFQPRCGGDRRSCSGRRWWLAAAVGRTSTAPSPDTAPRLFGSVGRPPESAGSTSRGGGGQPQRPARPARPRSAASSPCLRYTGRRAVLGGALRAGSATTAGTSLRSSPRRNRPEGTERHRGVHELFTAHSRRFMAFSQPDPRLPGMADLLAVLGVIVFVAVMLLSSPDSIAYDLVQALLLASR